MTRVLGDEDDLAGGAAHLGEPGGELVDAALGVGAGDLELGGEGAAEADGEPAHGDQEDGPDGRDLPTGGGHGTAESVERRGHGTSGAGQGDGGGHLPATPTAHSMHECTHIRYRRVSVV